MSEEKKTKSFAVSEAMKKMLIQFAILTVGGTLVTQAFSWSNKRNEFKLQIFEERESILEDTHQYLRNSFAVVRNYSRQLNGEGPYNGIGSAKEDFETYLSTWYAEGYALDSRIKVYFDEFKLPQEAERNATTDNRSEFYRVMLGINRLATKGVKRQLEGTKSKEIIIKEDAFLEGCKPLNKHFEATEKNLDAFLDRLEQDMIRQHPELNGLGLRQFLF